MEPNWKIVVLWGESRILLVDLAVPLTAPKKFVSPPRLIHSNLVRLPLCCPCVRLRLCSCQGWVTSTHDLYTLRVLQVSWHPAAPDYLSVLTSDNRLRCARRRPLIALLTTVCMCGYVWLRRLYHAAAPTAFEQEHTVCPPTTRRWRCVWRHTRLVCADRLCNDAPRCSLCAVSRSTIQLVRVSVCPRDC